MKIANNRKLGFSPGTGICTAIFAACIAWAPHAKAITFSGDTDGIFANPAGPSGMVTAGVGTDSFSWGTAFGNSTRSSLNFAGASFNAIPTGQFFTLGFLTYQNGTVLSGTQANSVNLLANLNFISPIGLSQDLNFAFQLINTPNVGTPEDMADSVFLSNLFPTITFNVGGIDYTLETGFGSVTPGGFVELNSFSVLEDASSSAELVGRITAPAAVPDTGSTLALMAMAIVGVGGLRQYMNCRA